MVNNKEILRTWTGGSKKMYFFTIRQASETSIKKNRDIHTERVKWADKNIIEAIKQRIKIIQTV